MTETVMLYQLNKVMFHFLLTNDFFELHGIAKIRAGEIFINKWVVRKNTELSKQKEADWVSLSIIMFTIKRPS